ncbi:hypothetical protein OC532_22560, partial [Vibrio vulnificus]|nr:hypothetical protein [Vibrio vulnificus]
ITDEVDYSFTQQSLVYSVLFVFTFLSQALYFNPLFLLFSFEFYNINTKNGTYIFLISRYKYKKSCEVDVPVANRINNYTFIERGGNGSRVGEG